MKMIVWIAIFLGIYAGHYSPNLMKKKEQIRNDQLVAENISIVFDI